VPLISDADTSDRRIRPEAARIRYRSTGRVPVAPPVVRSLAAIKREERARQHAFRRCVQLARLPARLSPRFIENRRRPCSQSIINTVLAPTGNFQERD